MKQNQNARRNWSRGAGVVVLAALLPLLAGCRTCECASCGKPMAATRRDKALKPVIRWLRERKYAATTNRVDGELVLDAVFADKPGQDPSSACRFTTTPEHDAVMVTATFSPAISDELISPTVAWLMSKNSDAKLGHYGFDPAGQQLWFRIALIRTDGKIKPAELDRALNETLTAMRDAHDVLSAGPDETSEAPLPAPNLEADSNVPRIVLIHHGLQKRRLAPVLPAGSVNQAPRPNQPRLP